MTLFELSSTEKAELQKAEWYVGGGEIIPVFASNSDMEYDVNVVRQLMNHSFSETKFETHDDYQFITVYGLQDNDDRRNKLSQARVTLHDSKEAAIVALQARKQNEETGTPAGTVAQVGQVESLAKGNLR